LIELLKWPDFEEIIVRDCYAIGQAGDFIVILSSHHTLVFWKSLLFRAHRRVGPDSPIKAAKKKSSPNWGGFLAKQLVD